MDEFWWPDPSALNDLTVEFEDTEDGGCVIHFDAPEGTEAEDWLNYFSESPERKAIFEKELLTTLLSHAQRIIDGENQNESDEQGQDRPGGQEDVTGSVEEHESGCDVT